MKTRRHFYTLVEMLCVMTVLAAVAQIPIMLFLQGGRACRETTQRVELSQQSMLLRRPWREFVAACTGEFELGADGVLRAGAASASWNAGRLALTAADGTKREYALPGKPEFSLERPPGLAECVVVEIAAAKMPRRRIVACR